MRRMEAEAQASKTFFRYRFTGKKVVRVQAKEMHESAWASAGAPYNFLEIVSSYDYKNVPLHA